MGFSNNFNLGIDHFKQNKVNLFKNLKEFEMEVLRSEVLKIVKKKDPLYPVLDDLAFRAKDVYNSALGLCKNLYDNTGYFYSYFELYRVYREQYGNYGLPIHTVQQILNETAGSVKSFVVLKRKYNKNPEQFRNRPMFPKIKDDVKGRYTVIFDSTQAKFRDGKIYFPEKVNIKPIETRLELTMLDGFFSKTEMNPIRMVRIVPRLDSYRIELVYKKVIEQPDTSNCRTAAAIDLGIDNFATVVTYGKNHARPIIINGRGIKSYNKNFNKRLAKAKSDAMKCNGQYTTKGIRQLYNKRSRVYKDFYHKASKAIVDYLKENEVHTLFIGYNKGWKGWDASKSINQTFNEISHITFIEELEYKAEEAGIQVEIVTEEFTSGTSFIDGEESIKENFNNKRRIYRGMFRTDAGIEINADVNAAYQILSKGSGYKWMFNTVNLSVDSFKPRVINIDTF